MKQFTYLEQYQYPTYVMLNLTDNCNLACIYCFVQQKPHYMTLDIAKKSVDFIINNYNIKKEKNILRYNEKKTLVFFGGEPTLMFDQIIIPLIHYIEEVDNLNEFMLHITTNGTLLNEERIKFLAKYNIIPLLSIDGDRETQEYNRPCKNCKESSFDLVKKNIPILLKYFPNTTFRSTVYKDTINNLYNNFLFAESMGFQNFSCIPDIRSQNWTDNDLNNYKLQLIKISEHIMNQYLNNSAPKMYFNNLDRGFDSVIIRDVNVTNNENHEWQNTFTPSRCGLGTNGCSINYKGEIFSCQEQDSRDEKGEYFYIGNIFDGIDKTLQSRVILDYINSFGGCERQNECLKCPLKNECNHGCPSTQKDLFDDPGKCAYIGCKNQQIIFYIAASIMSILVQENNMIFKNIIETKIKRLCNRTRRYR